MPITPNCQHTTARKLRKGITYTSALTAATSAINTCLDTLDTAGKNRLLLALHAQIGEQLDALAANNET
jgi:hypothetical protein